MNTSRSPPPSRQIPVVPRGDPQASARMSASPLCDAAAFTCGFFEEMLVRLCMPDSHVRGGCRLPISALAIRHQACLPQTRHSAASPITSRAANSTAAVLLKVALARSQSNADAHYLAANLEIERGDFARALHHAQRAVRLRPEAVDFAVTLGEVHSSEEFEMRRRGPRRRRRRQSRPLHGTPGSRQDARTPRPSQRSGDRV